MQAKVAFLANEVRSNDGMLDVSGMFGIITATAYPCDFDNFSLAIVADALKAEMNEPWPIRIIVEGGDPSQVLLDHTGEIDFGPSDKEGIETEAQMVLRFQSITLPTPGTYYFRYSVPGRVEGAVPLIAR